MSLFFVALAACDGPMMAADAGADSGVDGGPPPRVLEELPAEMPLQAGVAEVELAAPLGIGTMGFGPASAPDEHSPFADNYPPTRRQHTRLTIRSVALSRGEGHEVVLVRLDTIGVFQQLRTAVLRNLESRGVRDLSHALILAGNHTHAGPGRILQVGGLLQALSDSFWPEFYERFVDAIADAVEASIDDLAAAEIGFAMADTDAGHQDRRCENDALDQAQMVGDLPLIGIRKEGELVALVGSYAYHGTVLPNDSFTLSGDIGSVMEQKIEERFDHPILTLLFNSFGGDMSPARPEIPDEGADQPSGYDRMEVVGDLMADAVFPAVDAMTYSTDVTVRARTFGAPINRDVLAYTATDFRYAHGALNCGGGGEGNCENDERIEALLRSCVRVNPNAGVLKQTVFTAGQIGDFNLMTAPGEWTTGLADHLIQRINELGDADETMFIGYANDHTAYSLSEDDWWQGGYETAGTIWGPRQGDYLEERAFGVFAAFHATHTLPTWWPPAEAEPFSDYELERYEAETAIAPGTVAMDVPAAASRDQTLTFVIQGRDPWLGLPTATLERELEGGFEAVRTRNGRDVSSRGYELWLDLAVDPPYAEGVREDQRTFNWSFSFPLSRAASAAYELPPGRYRFAVELPDSTTPQVVHTAIFELSE